MKEDAVWDELRDNWTGRVYHDVDQMTNLRIPSFYICDDKDGAIFFKRTQKIDSEVSSIPKKMLKQYIEDGLMVRSNI